MNYISRIIDLPTQSFFLLGPRGTGKSTWLRQTLPEAHWIDLLSEETYQGFLANPGLFAAELRPLGKDDWVVVDEIQRLPNLLNEVHRFIEGGGPRFVLCGSSARKLRRAGVNLLAGRALQCSMHPFVPEELGGLFDLDVALENGLLPLVWNAPDPGEAVRAYVQTYLSQEIQAEALVRNLPGFARFLPISALLHGQNLNLSNVAREAGIARSTAEGYLQILEETLLGFRLPTYEAKLRVRERKQPKWYWCDPGIVRSMKRTAAPLHPEEKGALFEGLVAQILRAYRDYHNPDFELYYWSPAESRSVEVDFLLSGKRGFVAIEVKSGNRFNEKWCRGLRAVRELPGLRRRLIVYPAGPALETEDGIEVRSFASFADLVARDMLFPSEA